MPTIAEAAREVIAEQGTDKLWFGAMDDWHEAYARAGGRASHPKRVWHAVQSALNRSPAWRVSGTIRSISWSGEREIAHKIYTPVTPTKPPASSEQP